MKKILICSIFSALLLTYGSFTDNDNMVYAATTTTNFTESGNVVTPLAEQKEWRYRIVDGKLQKRLWSITYDKWLTDWEWA